MPRGSTINKRLLGAVITGDTRHENIPVGSSKKAWKHRSSIYVNGHAKAPDSPTTSSSPTRNGHYAVSSDNAINIKMEAENLSKSLPMYPKCSSDPYPQSIPESSAVETHRHIDVNAAKNPAVHRDLGPLNLAFTVLRSCPLSDTLAILIVLLQIPPTFLSMIHLLFATLTFVPSSSVATSGLTYTDVLQGNLGTPSLTTIVFLDFAVLLVWLFLWSPMQNIALDLAQTVIAITLGGGTSGKEAGIRNVLWCLGITGASHFFRTGQVRNSSLRSFISSNLGSSSDSDDPLDPILQKGGRNLDLIRSVLAIHIVTQGVVRYIRDWYVRRENRDISVTFGDPEAGQYTVDMNSDVSISQTPESECSASPSTSTASTTTKKKKRSCAQVRIQQPLWAALASTKIVMIKEYETSHTAAESAGTNATDMNNLGNAPFDSEADKIWLTYVGSDEVYFSTSYFPTHTTVGVKRSMGQTNIDTSKPFFVKVNNTVWQSARIYAVTDPDSSDHPIIKWAGEIIGLAPTSNYQCDFISTVDMTVLFSASVRTLQSPTADLGLSNTKTGGRPSSPYSTLKTSIAQAVKKLEEDRQRQKSSRREVRAKLNSFRKELERLVVNISSTGGNDDKLKQKAQQSTLHMKQADEAAAILSTQIEAIEKSQTDETSVYSKCRSEIQSQREKHKLMRSEISSSKYNAERDIQALRMDSSSLLQKSDSRKQRLNILNSKHESITDANAKGIDEAQRWESGRDVKRKERANIQAFYTERLHSLASQIFEGQAALHAVCIAIETLLHAQQEIFQNFSPISSSQNLHTYGDLISENSGTTASNYPWNSSTTSNNVFPAANNYSPMLSTVVSSIKTGNRTRLRSSSMLSSLSKFTQSSDEGPILSTVGKRLLSWDDTMENSSGPGSRSGSVGDPKSPIIASHMGSSTMQ
ncbi:unnamed protein product [Blumeria hordei]|uniref:Ubiquitination network signaling protein n=1 Tax=Blumeria hordei TaxID=2867405 RepID=A0A383UMD6_BLUHO|nr:unnamed protein product [Blumeria hordei]